MEQFVRLIVAGVVFGAVYTLLSVGVVLIHRVSRVVNLAHGALGIAATYVFYYVFIKAWHLPVAVASVLTLLVGAALGVALERLVVSPVRRDGNLATLVATVGVLLLLTDGVVQVFGIDQDVIPSVFSDRSVQLFGTGVTVHQLGTLAVAGVLVLALSLLVGRTRYGSALEAIAADPGAARLVGLPVRALTTATWALGGALAALAGLLYIHLNAIDPTSLTFVLVAALTAAIFGGMHSFALTAAGSMAIGVVFSLSQGYVTQSGFGNLAVFVVLLAVLLGNPRSADIRAEMAEF